MTSTAAERLAAGVLLASFSGTARPEWLRPWLELGLGGVVLFATNVADRAQVRELTASLRADGADLVIAVDEEGGDVTRLEAREGSSYPSALGLGVVDDTELTRRVAAAIGGELGACGIDLCLAPVADVNTNPANPVIGVRSFGSDPELVARHVGAFVAGLHERGVAACAKHFPGHGDTPVDSHLELPAVSRDRAGLDAVELVPFRAAVGARVDAVMTAHIAVPAVDGSPATLSRRLLQGVLRGELGFDGVVVTDALDMRAIAGTVGVAEGAVRALEAGADALCLGPSVDAKGLAGVHAAVVAAVESGRLPLERPAEAAGRIRALGARPPTAPAGGGDARLGAEAARRALRVRGDVAGGSSFVVVELQPPPLVAAGATGGSLCAALRRRGAHVLHVTLRDGETLPPLPTEARVVAVVRDAARLPWQRDLVARVLAVHPDAVVVETGAPGGLPHEASGVVETHGAGRASLEAAAELLALP